MIDQTDFDSQVYNVEEIADKEIKINPDFYVHNALLKAQTALVKDNVKEGFLQYRIIIEHIETLCRSAKMLTEEYEENLRNYMNSEEHNKEIKEDVKLTKLANKKLGFMMKEVFAKRGIIDKLRL